MQMKYNQKILELHPQQSKLINSLCFQLAVNIPDENSLSLLEILEMRRASQINQEEFRQLYRDWLQSKNIFDIFTAKQVKIFPKVELVANQNLAKHLSVDSILSSLELLNNLYNDLYLSRRKGEAENKNLQDIQDLFQYLDINGNIHLGLSELFFLAAATMVYDGAGIPLNYENFKPQFKKKNKELCQVEGMVCLRWFKSHFLTRGQGSSKAILQILKEISRGIKRSDSKSKLGNGNLPDILTEALLRWRNSSRNGLFETKKKKFQIYQRIFSENQEIFFFNGRDDNCYTQNWFSKKYSQEYIKFAQIDTNLLRQFGNIVLQIINEYLGVISKVSTLVAAKHTKSHNSNSFATYQTPGHQTMSVNTNANQPYNPFKSGQPKKNMSGIYNTNSKISNSKLPNSSSFKEKTPVKTNKGNQTRRFNATPTHKNNKMSPFISKHFGSTQKSLSKNKTSLTPPSKSYNGGYPMYMGQSTQIYRNSKKEGLQKDSFYEKLFFFRNKRVESFDIVMKRLKGK